MFTYNDLHGVGIWGGTAELTVNSPHGLALKLSPQNPSASPVLEVAPLSPIGNFPIGNFPMQNSLCASPVLEVAPVQFCEVAPLPYRKFPYREFLHREFPYRNFSVFGPTPIENFLIENLLCDTIS